MRGMRLATLVAVWLVVGCAGPGERTALDRSTDAGRLDRVIAVVTDDRWAGRSAEAMPDALVAALEQEMVSVGLIEREPGKGYRQRVTGLESPDAVNLVGMLPGRGALANEAVVVLAHYDGQGMNAWGEIRPGADDNASGVAATLAAFDGVWAHHAEPDPRRAVVLLLTTGEELQLQGAQAYLAEGTGPLPVAFVNVDMVGRRDGDRLGVFGTDTHRGWWGWAGRASRESGVRIDRHGRFVGSSDHEVYVEAGYPAVLVHTGDHIDRHTIADTLDRLDMQGIDDAARFIAALVRQLAVAPELAPLPEVTPGGVE